MRCLPEVVNGIVMRANRATGSLLDRDRPARVVWLDGKPFGAGVDSVTVGLPARPQGELSDWTGKYVHVKYARATLREVKAAHGDIKDRIVDLEPRAVETLARLHDGQSAGAVFKRGDGEAWHADPPRAHR